MTATVETPIDLGPCGWCEHLQWAHKRGKNGCKELGCPCGKYEPPKAAPAPAPVVEVDPASAVPGELVDGPDGPDLGVCVGGFEPAQPGDVELPVAPAVEVDPAAQAEHAEQVAAIDAPLADPEPTDDEVAAEIDRAEAAAEIERLTAELEKLRGVEASRERLAQQVVTLTGKLDEARDGNRRLREELTRAEGNHATALEALRKTADAYVQTGVAAATRVLYRYDGDQCTTEGCGSRYTVPVEHEHPLTPVTVLVVRREVPDVA